MALLLTACDGQLTVDNSVVNTLDLNRYLGDWYEIARFDHRFERGMEQTKATYTLREDGKIDVLNTGIKDGKPKEAKGKGKLTDTPLCCVYLSLARSTLIIVSCCLTLPISMPLLVVAVMTTSGFCLAHQNLRMT